MTPPRAPDDAHAAFRDAVAASRLQDPRPTFENLSAFTGVPVDDLVHHALVRWVSSRERGDPGDHAAGVAQAEIMWTVLVRQAA